MNEDKTQPELVWFNGRWFLKSIVDRIMAEREAEKAEAQRVLLANVEGWRALSRAAHALAQAEKGKAPVSGPAKPVESQEPNHQSQMEQGSGEAARSGQIKVAPETVAEGERGEATPGNAGTLAGESGGEVAASPERKEPSGRMPAGTAWKAALPFSFSSSELSRSESNLSDQIKVGAETAERKSGEATSQPPIPQSDPPSLGSRLRRATAWQAGVAGPIKAEATSRVDADPGNAGNLAGPVGIADGTLPFQPCTFSPAGTRPPCVPRDSLSPSRPAVPGSDQIKANAEESEQESGEATRRSDPPLLRSGVASPIKPQAKSAAEEKRGEATQIKAEAYVRSRKGKIAGLPEEIREALNERMENGEEGKALLDWLNGLPEVQNLVHSEYDGARIQEQNLSAWRKGGYADWLERNALVEVGLRLQENVAEWKEAGDLDLPQVLGHWLTGQYALATRNMGDLQGHEKWAQLWRIGRGVMRLRQVQEQEEKVKLAEARFAWKQEREAKRAEERAIVRALRAEEKAKRPRREPTEEETEEAAQECREIFKPETEEDRAYYYKLRRDAEVADALARGEEPPPEPVPIMEQECSTHVTKGRYF